jgi:hypothetical protein
LLVRIETYEYLEKLDGPSADFDFLEEPLSAGSIVLCNEKLIKVHPDLTSGKFRSLIID